MFPWADPHAEPVVATYEPAVAQRMVEAIADAVCAPWRKDARIVTSVRQWTDPQTLQKKNDPLTKDNFFYWTAQREDAGGLVQNIHIRWGPSAKLAAEQCNESFSMSSNKVPLWVSVILDKSRIAVDGPASKRGTTRYRLEMDAYNAAVRVDLGVNMKVRFW